MPKRYEYKGGILSYSNSEGAKIRGQQLAQYIKDKERKTNVKPSIRTKVYEIYKDNDRKITEDIISQAMDLLENMSSLREEEKTNLILEWIIREDYRKNILNDNKELQTIQVSIEKYGIDIDDIINSIVDEKFGRKGTEKDKQRFKMIISNQIKTFINNSKNEQNMNDKSEKER